MSDTRRKIMCLRAACCYLLTLYWAVIALPACALDSNKTLTKASAKKLDKVQIDRQVENLLQKLTLEQKIGQMSLQDWSSYNENQLEQIKKDILDGKVGGFLNVPRSSMNPDAFNMLQKLAVEGSAHGIPLIFGHDVIHGYKTIFPIPLGQAASWNPSLVEKGARVAALEATSVGIRWTFAPMIDISRDARWGRIAESLGEDVYLTSVLGAAMVRGFQGDDLTQPDSLAACAKHFAAYGAAEGGRDYNSANVPERLLRDVYLPPFKAVIDAGAASIMTSYSELDGVPATGDKKLLTSILRGEWGFEGFVVSDWNSVMEMIPHGYAKDAKQAAMRAANAGVDFEMHSKAFREQLPQLLDEGLVSMAAVDNAVRRMLRAKLSMGLFTQPYAQKHRQAEMLNPKFLAQAKQAAIESFVLLKNKNKLLPLKKSQEIAVIGPMAEVPYQQMGTWVYEGDKKNSRTLLPALKSYLSDAGKVHYASGLPYSRSKDTSSFKDAIEAAKKSELVIFFGGEEAILTGEGHSRGDISLPGAQIELINELAKLGKPMALVILAGRPISLEGVINKFDSVMMAWHPGTMAGPALVDVLYGEQSPSGRLPLSWPKSSGQIPVYYDHKATGRPASNENYTSIDEIDPGVEWQHAPGNSSNYLDYGHQPQFPFGFGLSYSQFEYKNLKIKRDKVSLGDKVEVSVTIKNIGDKEASEIVQLYIQDMFAEVTRPVKQLKRFAKVTLAPGKSKKIKLSVHSDELGFHNRDNNYVTEAGIFNLWVGKNASHEDHMVSFELVQDRKFTKR